MVSFAPLFLREQSLSVTLRSFANTCLDPVSGKHQVHRDPSSPQHSSLHAHWVNSSIMFVLVPLVAPAAPGDPRQLRLEGEAVRGSLNNHESADR